MVFASAFLFATVSASQQPYFPPSFEKASIRCDGFDKQIEIVSPFENKWYSEHLVAAEEPSLYLSSLRSRSSGGSLRFTWLPSFHHPITVRVEGLGTAAPRLIAKELSGAGGYSPGKISKRLNRTLSPKEASRLAAVLAKTLVLEMRPKQCDLGLDGAQWIFESVDRRGYRFVERWTPQSGPVRELGLEMLRLTGWKFKEVY